MKQSHNGKYRSILTVIILILSTLMANTATAVNPTAGSDDVIAGAGAHFAWVVFDMLKEELEEKSNRQIILFGKNSALGVGCSAGIKMAKQNVPGRNTFGFVCCPLAQEEIDKEGLLVYPLAKEPIMILVNANNPIDNLTSDQVKQIFRGEITNWSHLGGNYERIVVVTRLHCKKRPGHWKTILPSHEHFRKDRVTVKSAASMISSINDYSAAFGHTGSTWKFSEYDRVKIVSIDGYQPTAANVKSGKYPFYRQLSAVTNQKPGEDILNIIRTVQTGESFSAVAKKYELIPLYIE